MADRPHLLIVDDDREIRSLLGQYLEKNDFRTTAVQDAREMRRVLERAAIDLIVLDLMLPGEDGLTLCRELRTHSQIPVIMLTARGEGVDRIVGLEIGADDYLPKPFNPRELVARIRAILRRTKTAPQSDPIPDVVRVGEIELDPATRTVRQKGVPIEFTSVEFNLLEVLLREAGRVVAREELVDTVLSRKFSPF